MKRMMLFCLTFLTALLLVGCEIPDTVTEPTETQLTTLPTESVPEETQLEVPPTETLPEETQPTEPEPVVYYTQQGDLTPETSGDTATVWANGTAPGEIHTDVYLEVETNGTVLTYELGEWNHYVLPEGTFSLADLDGDGTDEMVLIMTVTGNGGALAQVFGVRDNEIVLLWDLNDVPLDITTRCEDGYLVVLENASVGFSQEVDISGVTPPEEFDENGKYMGSYDAYIFPVSTGFVTPVTENQLPTITCTMEAFCPDVLGYITAVLQYNPATETLQPVKITFEPRIFP